MLRGIAPPAGALLTLRTMHRAEEIAVGWGISSGPALRSALRSVDKVHPEVPFKMNFTLDCVRPIESIINTLPTRIGHALHSFLSKAWAYIKSSLELCAKYKWWFVAVASLIAAGALIYFGGQLVWNRAENQMMAVPIPVIGSPLQPPDNGASPPNASSPNASPLNATTGSDDLTCVVCMDNFRSHCFADCGHLAMCQECIDDIDVCPICRGGGKKMEIKIP